VREVRKDTEIVKVLLDLVLHRPEHGFGQLFKHMSCQGRILESGTPGILQLCSFQECWLLKNIAVAILTPCLPLIRWIPTPIIRRIVSNSRLGQCMGIPKYSSVAAEACATTQKYTQHGGAVCVPDWF
jgi:hypothetical protein